MNGTAKTGINGSLERDDLLPVPSKGYVSAANEATKEVYELINARGEIYLTSGVVKGIYAIRVVSANPKAEEKFLRKAFDILVRTTEEVLGRKRDPKAKLTNGVNGHS